MIEVNRLEIQKGVDRQVMLYWYQGRGRVVASEYWNKALTVADALRLNRTDGAFVRIMAPLLGSAESIDTQLSDFVATLFPELHRHLPL
jgi:EpsI family protein